MARHARLIAAALATSAMGAVPGLAQTGLPQTAPVQGGVAQPAAAPPGGGLAQTFLGTGGATPTGQEGAVSTLLDQANYWRLQNRPELVLRTLERVLIVDPRNVDALTGAAQAQAQLGNRQAAEGFLSRLRQVAPSDPRLSDTDITVRAQTVDQGALAEARRLGQAGRAAEAAQRYRELFRGAAPPDAYAQEYYATLAGTDQGYAEARDGLARCSPALAQRYPAATRLCPGADLPGYHPWRRHRPAAAARRQSGSDHCGDRRLAAGAAVAGAEPRDRAGAAGLPAALPE